MIPANRPLRALRRHRARRRQLQASLWLGALVLGASAVDLRAAVSPTPLAGVASSTPELRMPAGEPQKLVVQPVPAAAAGGDAPTMLARGEGRVAVDKPVAFVFNPEKAGLYSIGVSSPANAARISVFLGKSQQAAAGTSLADGAIRWSSELAAKVEIRILVHTAGAEIPFRVEASGGASGM